MTARRPRSISSLAIVLIATMLLLPLAPAFGRADCSCDETMCVHRHPAGAAHHGSAAPDGDRTPDEALRHHGERAHHGDHSPSAVSAPAAPAGSHCGPTAKSSPVSTVRGCDGDADHVLPSFGLGALPRPAALSTPQGTGSVPALPASSPLDRSPSIDAPPPDASVN